MTEQADVIVVGMGPGGEDVAERLAEAGLDVVGMDAELVGGECPYWGCVPSKMIIRASNLLAEAGRIPGMAGSVVVHPDWSPVAARIREEATDSWDDLVAVQRFEGKGGRFVRGWAKLDGPRRVVVGDRSFEARRGIVIGTGARAWIPPVPGLADTPYWTNREAIETEDVPGSLAVIGGGAIGVELAQAFHRFGSSVTVLEAGPGLVGPEEPEAAVLLTDVLESEGVDVRVGVSLQSVRHDGRLFTIASAEGRDVVAERLLVATGRHVDLAALAVASVGLDETARALDVDDHLHVTGADGLWAVGDVTGKGAFTHVSMYQADIVVRDILGLDVTPGDYRAVPRVTFTDPEIGSVGLTEREARDRGLEVRIGMSQLPSSARGWIHKAGNEGFIKLVEDSSGGILVGATSIGPMGGEVLGLLTLAVHARVPVSELRSMMYAYPTFHRAIETAVRELDAGS
jgi:pyruvate/2-oxoglutarate dehydrogenase complex dihydrolipoamide dehydrogenase (E3) component